MQTIRPIHNIDRRFKYFIVGSLLLHTIFVFWLFFYQIFVPHLEISTITINLGSGGGSPEHKTYINASKTTKMRLPSKMLIPQKQLNSKTYAKQFIQKPTSTTLAPSQYVSGTSETNTNGKEGGAGIGNGNGNGIGYGTGQDIVSSNQLDNYPKLISFKAPVYPVEARKQGIEGVVVLKVLIAPDGKIKDIKILKSIQIFDESAIQAVNKWRFTPITSHGNPVYVWMIIPIRFQLK